MNDTSSNAAVTSQMDSIVAGLRQNLALAKANVGGGWSDSTDRNMLLHNLEVDSGYVEKLATDFYDNVLNGTWSYEKWYETSRFYWSDIQAQDSTVNDWSFSSAVSFVYKNSVSDIENASNVVSNTTSTAVKAGLAGLAVYGLVAVVVGVLIFKRG